MQPAQVVSYPHAPGHRRKRPTPVDLPVPTFSRTEWLVVLGIILILLAVAVPVVHKVRESANKAAEEMQRQSAPATLEDAS